MTHAPESQIVEIGKALPHLAKEIYSDAVAKTLQEVSKIGVDAAKTVRLALFPLQLAGALQDRVANYIDRALRAVPEPRRISPRQSIVLAIADQLRLHDESDVIADLYVNLLSRALDMERVGEAHPAFITIISQMAPDEAAIIEQLGRRNLATGRDQFRLFFRRSGGVTILSKRDVIAELNDWNTSGGVVYWLQERAATPEKLAQPELFSTLLEHLVSLGLVQYDNESRQSGLLKDISFESLQLEYFCIKLSEFGSLFYSACISRESEKKLGQ